MSSTMTIGGQPVVFCFVAWMKNYKGVTADDVPVWDSVRAEDGFAYTNGKKRVQIFLGESSNFLRVRDIDGKPKAFGHVQARFATNKLGGSKDLAHNLIVVWCAADPRERNRVKLVGWYQGATVHRSEQKLSGAVHRRDLGKFPEHDGYNVVADFGRAHLLPEEKRPPLPVTPGNSLLGRWHSQSKQWKGGNSTRLLRFVRRMLDKSPELLRGKKVATTKSAITKRQILQTVRDRQGQGEFRKILLLAYDFKCAVTGSTTRDVLDACHIHPVSQGDSYHGADNGLLLRTDLHALFDLGHMSVHPVKKTVWISKHIREEKYLALSGKPLRKPTPGFPQPSTKNLRRHWDARKK